MDVETLGLARPGEEQGTRCEENNVRSWHFCVYPKNSVRGRRQLVFRRHAVKNVCLAVGIHTASPTPTPTAAIATAAEPFLLPLQHPSYYKYYYSYYSCYYSNHCHYPYHHHYYNYNSNWLRLRSLRRLLLLPLTHPLFDKGHMTTINICTLWKYAWKRSGTSCHENPALPSWGMDSQRSQNTIRFGDLAHGEVRWHNLQESNKKWRPCILQASSSKPWCFSSLFWSLLISSHAQYDNTFIHVQSFCFQLHTFHSPKKSDIVILGAQTPKKTKRLP